MIVTERNKSTTVPAIRPLFASIPIRTQEQDLRSYQYPNVTYTFNSIQYTKNSVVFDYRYWLVPQLYLWGKFVKNPGGSDTDRCLGPRPSWRQCKQLSLLCSHKYICNGLLMWGTHREWYVITCKRVHGSTGNCCSAPASVCSHTCSSGGQAPGSGCSGHHADHGATCSAPPSPPLAWGWSGQGCSHRTQYSRSLHTSQPSHGLAQPEKEDIERQESEEKVLQEKKFD